MRAVAGVAVAPGVGTMISTCLPSRSSLNSTRRWCGSIGAFSHREWPSGAGGSVPNPDVESASFAGDARRTRVNATCCEVRRMSGCTRVDGEQRRRRGSRSRGISCASTAVRLSAWWPRSASTTSPRTRATARRSGTGARGGRVVCRATRGRRPGSRVASVVAGRDRDRVRARERGGEVKSLTRLEPSRPCRSSFYVSAKSKTPGFADPRQCREVKVAHGR